LTEQLLANRHERISKAIYYSWKVTFAINLRADDAELLRKIQNKLEVGSITFTKNQTSVRLQVSDLFELKNVIVPFFKKHPLLGKKGEDFILWSEAVEILLKYKKARGEVNVTKGQRGFQKVLWKKKDIERLRKIQQVSSKFKSKAALRKWGEAKLGREKVSA